MGMMVAELAWSCSVVSISLKDTFGLTRSEHFLPEICCMARLLFIRSKRPLQSVGINLINVMYSRCSTTAMLSCGGRVVVLS
jgi:hypothetical protein